MRRLLALAGVAAGLAVLAGCGVPVSGTATVLDNVPDTLMAPAATVPVPPREHKPPGGVFDIFLVFGGRTIAVPRPDDTTQQLLPQLLLNDLESGPNQLEAHEGITTALYGGATIVRIRGDVATVNIDASVGQLPEIALAQIIFTMTELANPTGNKPITKVAFYQAGSPVDAPNENGVYESRPLTRADVARFFPAGEIPVTTPTTKPPCSSTNRQSVQVGACPS